MSQEKNRRLLHISAFQTAGNGAVLFAICFLNIRAAGALKKAYESYGAELPSLTRLLYMYPPVFYAAVFAGLIIALVVKEIFIEDKTITILINSILAFSLFLALALYCAAAFLPLLAGNMYG